MQNPLQMETFNLREMAKIEDVFKVEGNRSVQEQWLQIHLFKEGNFYRAYEQSAWLMSHYAGSDLQAKKHKTKQSPDGSFVFVGFPVSSLDKFRPKESGETEETDTNHVVLVLPSQTFPEEASVEVLADDFSKWKREMAYTDAKADNDERKDKNGLNGEFVKSAGGVRVTGILQELLSYPIESKSPIETMLFVAELKKKLSNII